MWMICISVFWAAHTQNVAPMTSRHILHQSAYHQPPMEGVTHDRHLRHQSAKEPWWAMDTTARENKWSRISNRETPQTKWLPPELGLPAQDSSVLAAHKFTHQPVPDVLLIRHADPDCVLQATGKNRNPQFVVDTNPEPSLLVVNTQSLALFIRNPDPIVLVDKASRLWHGLYNEFRFQFDRC